VPIHIGKHERRFTGFDDKIIAMYARGMTVREIQGYLAEMYTVEVSPELISKVTDAVMSEVTAWQSRPLEYPGGRAAYAGRQVRGHSVYPYPRAPARLRPPSVQGSPPDRKFLCPAQAVPRHRYPLPATTRLPSPSSVPFTWPLPSPGSIDDTP
jgi:hypothetical protein